VAIGSTVSFVGSSSVCVAPLYEFWIQYPNGTWYMKRVFGGSTFDWITTALAPGTYNAHVWANQTGDSQATWEAWGSTTVTLTGCISASLIPNPGSGPTGSTAVQLTAASVGCSTTPQYEFWVQYLNGTWKMIQPFGPSATFNWSTGGLAPGAYNVHVWANGQGDPQATWEAYGSDVVTLTGCASSPPPTSDVPSPQKVGTKVTFTASSICTTPVYEFWLQYPGGSWYLMQKFTPTTTWQWNTAGYPKGNYVVHVWTNNQGSDYSTYETYGTATYTLT
jgi:hypothetical protein